MSFRGFYNSISRVVISFSSYRFDIDRYVCRWHNTFLYRLLSWCSVCDGLNRTLGDVHNWCRNNKLTIHNRKSEVMVINRKSFIGPLKPVSLGNKTLSYVNTSTCLGVVIDSKLSWQPQITAVCTTFSQKVRYLKQLRVLPKKVLEAIYFRSIVPIAIYGTSTGLGNLLPRINYIMLNGST